MALELLALSPDHIGNVPTSADLKAPLLARVRDSDTGDVRTIPVTIAPAVIGDGRPERPHPQALLTEALGCVHDFPTSGHISRDGNVTLAF